MASLLAASSFSLQLRIFLGPRTRTIKTIDSLQFPVVRCSLNPKQTLKTCKICKTQFDPSLNHPRACRFHTAHFGGETKRKFESVYTGGTMNTPDSGQVFQYWHCCGAEVHLILDALLLLTLPMMTDGINAISRTMLGLHG